MSIFEGSGVALVTPFDDNNNINYNELEKLINFHIDNKTDALVVCATTGEAATLTDEEKSSIIKFCVEITRKRIPIIAGTGSNNTIHAIELSKRAEQLGADACLVVTPYYNKKTQKGLFQHYKNIAESIQIPVMLYNVPARTSMNLLPETVYQLSKIKNIVAIKDASGDISQVAKIAELCGSKIDIYAGNDNQVVPTLSLGGKGVITVLGNIAPKEVHNMVMAYLQGDLKVALSIQLQSLDLISVLFREISPSPVKNALSMMGFDTKNLRMPLIEIDDITKENLAKEMVKYGIEVKI